MSYEWLYREPPPEFFPTHDKYAGWQTVLDARGRPTKEWQEWEPFQKLLEFSAYDEGGSPLLVAVDHTIKGYGLTKMAAPFPAEMLAKIAAIEHDDNKLHVVGNALGATETFGSNRNQDSFPRLGLLNSDPKSYGHKTFEDAHVFKHHVNKDPNKAIGKVTYAYYDSILDKVLLLYYILKDKAPHIVDRLEKGESLETSMGCRCPYDVCSICGKKAKDRTQYCDHLKDHPNMTYPDGRKVMAHTPHPKFFDQSHVAKGADPIAKTLEVVDGHAKKAYDSRPRHFVMGPGTPVFEKAANARLAKREGEHPSRGHLRKAFGINDDGSLKQIESEKHECPKCGKHNAIHKERHADTSYNEMMLCCPDCGHEKSAAATYAEDGLPMGDPDAPRRNPEELNHFLDERLSQSHPEDLRQMRRRFHKDACEAPDGKQCRCRELEKTAGLFNEMTQPHGRHPDVEAYRQAAIGTGMGRSSPEEGNHHASILLDLHKRLKATPEGRAGISSLLKDKSPDVRSWAAAHSLEHDPENARATLKGLASDKDAHWEHRVSAEHTLREFDKKPKVAGLLDVDTLEDFLHKAARKVTASITKQVPGMSAAVDDIIDAAVKPQPETGVDDKLAAFSSEFLCVLEAMEPDLAPAFLDKLAKLHPATALSSLTAVGVVLKDHEFHYLMGKYAEPQDISLDPKRAYPGLIAKLGHDVLLARSCLPEHLYKRSIAIRSSLTKVGGQPKMDPAHMMQMLQMMAMMQGGPKGMSNLVASGREPYIPPSVQQSVMNDMLLQMYRTNLGQIRPGAFDELPNMSLFPGHPKSAADFIDSCRGVPAWSYIKHAHRDCDLGDPHVDWLSTEVPATNFWFQEYVAKPAASLEKVASVLSSRPGDLLDAATTINLRFVRDALFGEPT